MALPILVIDAPPLERLPRGQLFDVATPIRPHAPINGDANRDNRWLLNGVTWTPEPCYPLFTADVDACNTVATNNFTDFPRGCEPPVTQSAFSVYDAFRGSPLEYTAQDLEDLLMGRMTVKVSAAFASELTTGAASGDRALSKSATAPTGLAFGAGTPLYNALPILENELARRLRGARGIIHMAPGMLSQAAYQCDLELNAAGQWETPLGNLVIGDAGYVSMAKPTGSATPGVAGTSDWVYASGMVQYAKTSPIMVDGGNLGSTITNYTGRENLTGIDPAQSSFSSRDRATRFIDVYGILVFDSCAVTAALVTYAENA